MKDSYIYHSDEKFKKDLKNAITNSVPDIFEDIYNDCVNRENVENKDNEVLSIQDKKVDYKKEYITKCRKEVVRILGTVAAMFAIILSVVMYGKYNSVNKIKSVVMLDVNPSIKVNINKDDQVVSVKGINEDGKRVLSKINIKKMKIEEALNQIIQSMINEGYVSEKTDAILVTIDNKDVKEGTRLEKKVSKDVDKLLKASNISVDILAQLHDEDDEINNLAKKNNISEGKAGLIKKLIKAEIVSTDGNIITVEEMTKLNISELNKLIKENNVKLDNIIINQTNEELLIVEENEEFNTEEPKEDNTEIVQEENNLKKEDVLKDNNNTIITNSVADSKNNINSNNGKKKNYYKKKNKFDNKDVVITGIIQLLEDNEKKDEESCIKDENVLDSDKQNSDDLISDTHSDIGLLGDKHNNNDLPSDKQNESDLNNNIHNSLNKSEISDSDNTIPIKKPNNNIIVKR